MNEAYILVLAAIGAVASDRLRGRYGPVFSLVTGACFGLLFIPSLSTENLPWLVGCAIANLAGTQGGGWGNVIGPIISKTLPTIAGAESFLKLKWQQGIFQKSVKAAALARGALWGACYLPLALLNKEVALMVPIVALAFAVSPYVAMKFKGGHVPLIPDTNPNYESEAKRSNEIWALTEYIRAGLASVCIVWIVLI